MAERKLIELELEVKEIILKWDIDISQVKTKVHIKEATKWINYQDSSSIRFLSLDANTKVQMWVIYDEDLIGLANFELIDYMGQNLKKTEIWIKLTSAPDGPFVFESENGPKVRLGLSTKEFVLPSRISKPVPILTCDEFPGQNSKCSYLRKIAQAQIIEKQAEDNVYKILENIGDLVGLSDYGPRSPGRSPTRSPQRVNNNVKKSGLEGTYLDDLLEIQIPSRYNLQIDRITDEEQRHMRNIVLALLHKTKGLQLQVTEIDTIHQHIETNTASQADLTESMNETEEQLNSESAQVQTISSLIINEVFDLDSEISKTENEISTLQAVIHNQTISIEPLAGHNFELKAREAEESQEANSQIEELLDSFETTESQRELKQVELEKFIASSYKERNKKIEMIHNLVIEKEHILTQIQSIKNNIDRHQQENRQLSTELFGAEAELLLNNHLKQKFTIDQKLIEPNTTLLKDVLETLVAERCDQQEGQKQFEDSIQQSTEDLNSEIATHQQEVDKFQEELKEIEVKMPGMEANLKQLSVLVGDQLDIDSFLTSSKVSYENSLRDRDGILSELTYMGDCTLQQASTSLQEHRIKAKLTVLDVNKQLELNGMRKLVIDEKRKNPIYNPDQDDPVDLALYEFLNRNKVSVPFVKEFSEVYLFGSRRIQLKLENEKLQVKVGGGFLTIVEFLKSFEHVESDKIQGKIENPAKAKNSIRPSSRRSSRSNLSPIGKSSRPQSGASTPSNRAKMSSRTKK